MLTMYAKTMLFSLETILISTGKHMRDAAIGLLPWAVIFSTSMDLGYARFGTRDAPEFDYPMCHTYEVNPYMVGYSPSSIYDSGVSSLY
jgi:hypothetical protein